MVDRTKSHGGFRDGAGRKPQYAEPTRRVAVPESQADRVVEYLAAYRDRRTLEDEGVRVCEPRPIHASRRRTAIPVVGYRPEAGAGSHAEDYVEEHVDLNAHLIRQGHEDSTFIVRASGWSMIGAGIHDGDEVIVDRAITPKNNDVVVAAINGDLVIKRLLHRGGKVALVSDNPHYPQRTLKEDDKLEIWGVATRCLHPL
jgi:DNA polymerase V